MPWGDYLLKEWQSCNLWLEKHTFSIYPDELGYYMAVKCTADWTNTPRLDSLPYWWARWLQRWRLRHFFTANWNSLRLNLGVASLLADWYVWALRVTVCRVNNANILSQSLWQKWVCVCCVFAVWSTTLSFQHREKVISLWHKQTREKNVLNG